MAKKKESAEKPSETLRVPSEEEMEVAWLGPAYNTNRFYINIGGSVRIAFCEQAKPDLKPHFRTAISLHFQDAIALKNVLTEVLADMEAEVGKAMEKAEAKAKKDG